MPGRGGGLMDSSSAMALLDGRWPPARRSRAPAGSASSAAPPPPGSGRPRSAPVSRPPALPAGRAADSAGVTGASSASATAASLVSAWPLAHSRATVASPRRRAGARYASTRAPDSAGRPAASRSAAAAAASCTASSGWPSCPVSAANASRPRATPMRAPVAWLSRRLLGQVPPGLLDRAEVHGHPAQAGQAASDLRPGVDLPQDGQRLHVPAVRLARVVAEPGQVTQAEQGPGDAPLLVDPAHHRDRGAWPAARPRGACRGRPAMAARVPSA